MIIVRALYGLINSGECLLETFSVVLHEKGFIPSKTADQNWVQPKGDHYEYIDCYINDLP